MKQKKPTPLQSGGQPRHYIFAGLAGAIASLTCCITPVILVMLGFGTAIAMAFMQNFHTISIISGIILVVTLCVFILFRETGSCSIESARKRWKHLALAAVSMIVGFLIINYGVVYPVAAIVYGNLAPTPPMNSDEHHGTAHVTYAPEHQGIKNITMEVSGMFCGSCGPGLLHDIQSLPGVLHAEESLSTFQITYDSNITSTAEILAQVHEPYTATLVEEFKKE